MIIPFGAGKSGVALRVPPQSMTRQPRRGDIFVASAMEMVAVRRHLRLGVATAALLPPSGRIIQAGVG